MYVFFYFSFQVTVTASYNGNGNVGPALRKPYRDCLSSLHSRINKCTDTHKLDVYNSTVTSALVQ